MPPWNNTHEKGAASYTKLATPWWERMDLNHRSEAQQIYSLPPLATRELSHIQFGFGAGGRTRTPDLLITNQLLYQLSYTGVGGLAATVDMIPQPERFVKPFFKIFWIFYCGGCMRALSYCMFVNDMLHSPQKR